MPQGHCEEHLDPLSIYCEQDHVLVCGVCASLGSHRGHQLLPAAEAHARLKVWDPGARRQGAGLDGIGRGGVWRDGRGANLDAARLEMWGRRN